MKITRTLGSLSLGLILLVGAPSFGENESTPERVFSVQGMSCALCGKAIEKSLRSVKGVSDVRVDESAEQIIVIASSEVETVSLLAAIESAGSYTAALVEPAGG